MLILDQCQKYGWMEILKQVKMYSHWLQHVFSWSFVSIECIRKCLYSWRLKPMSSKAVLKSRNQADSAHAHSVLEVWAAWPRQMWQGNPLKQSLSLAHESRVPTKNSKPKTTHAFWKLVATPLCHKAQQQCRNQTPSECQKKAPVALSYISWIDRVMGPRNGLRKFIHSSKHIILSERLILAVFVSSPSLSIFANVWNELLLNICASN